MNKKTEQELMAFGRALMARVTGGVEGHDPPWTKPFLDLLNPERNSAVSTEPLQSILTLIEVDGKMATPHYLRPVPLTLSAQANAPEAWPLMPADLAEASTGRRELYERFQADDRERGDDPYRFFHLMRKYASTLPNTYDEPGVSLFEQWKMVAALVGISGSTGQTPQALGLVGGDIPGIQRTINLVTAKGAAKAMRGRSAFIQLLGHALIERLLDVLDLGPANVVYDAGGNFLLLTGWDDDTADSVQEVATAVNQVLLAGTGKGEERFDGFHGDLAVALAAVSVPQDALRVPASGVLTSAWQQAERRVKQAVLEAKARPFGDLAQATAKGWQDLFGPEPAQTDDFCAVCRRQRMDSELPFKTLGDEDEGEGALVCPECWGFNQLANQMGHAATRLTLSFGPPREPESWERALHAISGRWYAVGKEHQGGDIVLVLTPDDFPGAEVDGFRTLAHTTPMTGERIRTNEELAQASSSGLRRLGVLRMDVDNLGNLIVHGLPRRTPMQTAELSQVLERFFAGWLDRICHRVGEDLFYVLFAGGDDLFVVGPWTRMPALAQAIRDDFERYTGGHEAIHLSAGIAVVGEKAPLYAAAAESHEALEAAKDLDRDTLQEKNAITFLARTLHWSQFIEATALKDDIEALAERDGLGNAVITRLLAIERRYHRDRQRGPYAVKGKAVHQPTDSIYYGPWMWQQAYALARLREGRPADVQARLKKLGDALLKGQITYLGLAARWAQWETRKGGLAWQIESAIQTSP